MNAVLGYKDHNGNRHSFLDTYDCESGDRPGMASGHTDSSDITDPSGQEDSLPSAT